jgi:predicted PurR-regulated permease PerM
MLYNLEMRVFFLITMIIFLCSASFGLAQTTTLPDINQLKYQYNNLINQLINLLQQRIQELTLQIEQLKKSQIDNNLSSSSTSSSVMNYSTSAKPYVAPYLPSWHLVPGSCFPVYY